MYGLLLFAAAKLHTLVGGLGPVAGGRQTHFNFLGQRIGRLCLCTVMSIGINRFRNALDMKPDMRVGASRKGVRYQSSQSVNAFLGILYNGVAETLPDRFMGPNSLIITLPYVTLQISTWFYEEAAHKYICRLLNFKHLNIG